MQHCYFLLIRVERWWLNLIRYRTIRRIFIAFVSLCRDSTTLLIRVWWRSCCCNLHKKKTRFYLINFFITFYINVMDQNQELEKNHCFKSKKNTQKICQNLIEIIPKRDYWRLNSIKLLRIGWMIGKVERKKKRGWKHVVVWHIHLSLTSNHRTRPTHLKRRKKSCHRNYSK